MNDNAAVALPRAYAPDLDPSSDHVVLSPDESHHLTRVLRLVPGEAVAVFDGRGREFLGRIAGANPRATRVRLAGAISSRPELAVRITLVQAVLKGNMDDVVRDATMAGVSHIAPIVTTRSLVKVSALKRGRSVERWQRIAIASAKQCRRAWIPTIDLAKALSEWLAMPFEGARLLMVEPSAAGDEGGVRTMRGLQASPRPAAAALLVGPEGGWTAAEREAAVAAGCAPVTLGHMTFRADAAALVAMGALTVVWGD